MRKPMTDLELAAGAYRFWVIVSTLFWLGSCAWRWWDYTARPELYAMNSAPWWAGALVYTLVYAGQLAAASALYWIARRRLKKRSPR